jgi:hypothetical protein
MSHWATAAPIHYPTVVRDQVSLGPHYLRFRLVSQPKPELAVDLALVLRFSLVQGDQQVPQTLDHRRDLLAAHARAGGPGGLPQLGFGLQPLGLGLGHPATDDDRVGARFQDRPMPSEFRVAFGDLAQSPLSDHVVAGAVVLCGGHGLNRSGELVLGELLSQPVIQRLKDGILTQVVGCPKDSGQWIY